MVPWSLASTPNHGAMAKIEGSLVGVELECGRRVDVPRIHVAATPWWKGASLKGGLGWKGDWFRFGSGSGYDYRHDCRLGHSCETAAVVITGMVAGRVTVTL